MAFINRSAINRNIDDVGESVKVKNYTSDVSYDTDQNPTRSSTTTTTNAIISDINKFQVDAIGSDITVKDKKVILKKGISVNVGDLINIASLDPGTTVVKKIVKHPVSGDDTTITAYVSRSD